MNNYPKLHNAAWPGMVGKGDDGEMPIGLKDMLDMTAAAEVDGVKFDGIDLFLFDPHVDINADDDEIKALIDMVQERNLDVGTLVAPVWAPTGGGSAMGTDEEQEQFVMQVAKACQIGTALREAGVRPNGGIRIDSAVDPGSWSADPDGNQKRIADTFTQACNIAEDFGETLVAEGEICWGGMHSWKRMVELLEMVNKPGIFGFQADMAHTLLYMMGYNAPEDALLPEGFDWSDTATFDAAYKTLTDALRPWTLDLHIAQNDATVKGAGNHDKTGRHCLPKDPNGKLDITKYAGYWLRDESGKLTNKIRHICWDGCMFTNETLTDPQTWNDILAAMINVRNAHGFQE